MLIKVRIVYIIHFVKLRMVNETSNFELRWHLFHLIPTHQPHPHNLKNNGVVFSRTLRSKLFKFLEQRGRGQPEVSTNIQSSQDD